MQLQHSVYDYKVTASDSLGRTGKRVTIGVFVALIVDGMDLQMLALSLPSISKELRISSVSAGALSTYTLLGMGIGGVLAGWLADRIGRVRVVWWSVLIFSLFTGVIALCHTYLADCGHALCLGIRTWCAIQHRDAARSGIRPHPSEDDRSRHAAGRLVGGVCVRGAALRVSTADIRMASALYLRDHSWHRHVGAPLEGARPSQLGRGAAGARTASASPFRAMWADPSLRRTFLLWTVAAIALQFGYYGANFVAAQLPREGSGSQRTEHGLVRSWHLHHDGRRQGHHWVPWPISSGGESFG